MTQKQIGIVGVLVAIIGVIIAYLTLLDNPGPSVTTSGDGSPVIQDSSNVTINN